MEDGNIKPKPYILHINFLFQNSTALFKIAGLKNLKTFCRD